MVRQVVFTLFFLLSENQINTNNNNLKTKKNEKFKDFCNASADIIQFWEAEFTSNNRQFKSAKSMVFARFG